MGNNEYECRRCLNRFTHDDDRCYHENPECPVCGSTALDESQGSADDMDVLRTKGAGSGC